MRTEQKLTWDESCEWLEADGLGGFASGTATGVRTRRYHALLLAAATPPTGRFVLLNGCDTWIEREGVQVGLSSQRYVPGVIHPDGISRLIDFSVEPWPTWTYRLDDGSEITQEVFVPHGLPATLMRWRWNGEGPARLSVRFFLSGRDYHSLQHENPAFRFEPVHSPGHFQWQTYDGVPALSLLTDAAYEHRPDWYRNFLYTQERQRELDDQEDLAAPGILSWDLSRGAATLIATARNVAGEWNAPDEDVSTIFKRLEASERRRRKRLDPLERSAEAYFVQRGQGKTIVAGYPWFTDWGRDTFIALRGLALSTGRLSEAGDILTAWSETVSEGMLPNRFPDAGSEPEFNSVDASLWFIVAVHDYLEAMTAAGKKQSKAVRQRLIAAVDAILIGYMQGTRYGIRVDSDGLLAAGEPGVQLTWMDAKVGDWVVTPRIGKPVEVQALWLNALRIASRLSERWSGMFNSFQSFQRRFWYEQGGYLYDVVDVDHQADVVDASLRPNQIFAVGGLPYPSVEGERAKRIVDVVEAQLWTPLGLRSLAPGSPGYSGRYRGGVRERDGAYHQGTVWPWLITAFVEAWLRVRHNSDAARAEAQARFVTPLLAHLDQAGLGHVSEIADGDFPHTPGGCPFQAWSVGELLRLTRTVLGE